MSNIVSIFTGQEPCEYLSIDEKQFRKFYKDNWFGTHLWDCQDCIKRYLNLNREAVAQVVQNVIVEGEGQDVSD